MNRSLLVVRPALGVLALLTLTSLTGCAMRHGHGDHARAGTTGGTTGDSAVVLNPSTSGPHQRDFRVTTGRGFCLDPDKPIVVTRGANSLQITVYGQSCSEAPVQPRPEPSPGVGKKTTKTTKVTKTRKVKTQDTPPVD